MKRPIRGGPSRGLVVSSRSARVGPVVSSRSGGSFPWQVCSGGLGTRATRGEAAGNGPAPRDGPRQIIAFHRTPRGRRRRLRRTDSFHLPARRPGHRPGPRAGGPLLPRGPDSFIGGHVRQLAEAWPAGQCRPPLHPARVRFDHAEPDGPQPWGAGPRKTWWRGGGVRRRAVTAFQKQFAEEPGCRGRPRVGQHPRPVAVAGGPQRPTCCRCTAWSGSGPRFQRRRPPDRGLELDGLRRTRLLVHDPATAEVARHTSPSASIGSPAPAAVPGQELRPRPRPGNRALQVGPVDP